MSCADGGTGDQLWPQAPCAGPLALWHKPQLVLSPESDRSVYGLSRGLAESAETCEKVPAGRFSVRSANRDRNAHIQGRADVKPMIHAHRRAHEEIQTHMPLEPHDRKPSGLPLYRTEYGKA